LQTQVKISTDAGDGLRAIPLVLVGTGLLFALERRDYDREGGTLTVERVYSQGVLKDCGKSSRQRRRVPLRQRVVDAIDAMPPRIDSKLLFPAPRGGPIDLEKFRHREWTPGLKAAGVEHRRIYDCRHTFASWSIAAGVPLFYLSRVMGCSITMLEQHFGGVLARAPRQLRRRGSGTVSPPTERRRFARS
jgi:integrase